MTSSPSSTPTGGCDETAARSVRLVVTSSSRPSIVVVLGVGRPGRRRSTSQPVLASFVATGSWRSPERRWRGPVLSERSRTGGACRAAWSTTTGTPAAPSWLIGATALLCSLHRQSIASHGSHAVADAVTTRTSRAGPAPADERRITVPRAVRADGPYRLVAGTSKSTGRRLAGEDCVSAVVIRAERFGQDRRPHHPQHPRVAGQRRHDHGQATGPGPRSSAPARPRGPVWVVAPGGAPGVQTASWSPVDYATDADAADRMAGWLVDSSGMTGDPRARAVERPGPEVPQGTAAGGPPLRRRDAPASSSGRTTGSWPATTSARS